MLGAEYGGNLKLLWRNRAPIFWHQGMGHKGPVLRPRYIRIEMAGTQLLLYTLTCLCRWMVSDKKGSSNRICKHLVMALRKLTFDFLNINQYLPLLQLTYTKIVAKSTASPPNSDCTSTFYAGASSQNSVLLHNSCHGYKGSSFHCLSVTAGGWQDLWLSYILHDKPADRKW